MEEDNLYRPKFGDIGNSEPAVQAEITVNAYLDKQEKSVRISKHKIKEGNGIVYPFGKTDLNDRTYSVRENEPAFIRRERLRKKNTIAKQFNIPKHDNYAHVFTSLNGLYLNVPKSVEQNWDDLDDEMKKYYVRDCLTLVGTIGTSYDATTSEGKIKYAYFPVRKGGVYAMRAGSMEIKSGQMLLVDSPLPVKKGQSFRLDNEIAKLSKDVDKAKAFMEVVPYNVDRIPTYDLTVNFFDTWFLEKDNKNAAILEEYLKYVKNKEDLAPNVLEVFFVRVLELLAFTQGVDQTTKKTDEWIEDCKPAWAKVKESDVLKNLMDSFFGIRTEINRRIIGIALTSAQKGCQLDVFVTHGYAV